MEKEQIRKLFKQGYNRNFWTQFLGQTFVGTQLYIEPEILTGINTNVAANAHKLGYINVNDDNIERQIGVFEVELSQGIILERNRVGLRNMLRSYWRDMDGAFIVYYHPNSTIKKWRFTYVSELAGYDAEGEYTKIVTEPKRYTYVLGQGESVRTATERFSQLAAKGSNATIDDIKEAFSVEKLSKSFFDEYKRHYQIFNDYILSSPQAKSCFSDYTTDKEKDIRDFTKKMLGRIIFLYFIQKKGWLGVPVDGKWGEGDFNFLSRLFETHDTPDTFYNEKLVKLFFETLNKERPNDEIELIEGEKCRVPYLNGGLFEAEDSNRQRIIFDGELFRNLFEFFNQYNFTIYEDDPNDHTVAVDPEMLGHIFENLLEDNKDKGAFYTPKEIVHYMCQESLIEYLTTWFEDKGYEVTSYATLGSEREPGLFSSAETSKQLTIETATNEKKIDRLLIEKLLKKQLDDDNKETVIQHSSEFHQALDKVKVCDPAIGSGAFPMGLLQEIFTTKETLWNFEHGNLIDFPASEVKLNIIQNSIYGVDIEKGAVDIARLRFWLSLVVDEETPKALPNLDYKIVTGNSLISKLDDTIIDIDWVTKDLSHGLFVDGLVKKREKLLQTIIERQKDFFDPYNNKKILSLEIKNLKIDLLINKLDEMVKRKGIENRPSGNGRAVAIQMHTYLQTLEWKNSIRKLQKLKEKPEKRLNFFDWKLDFPEVLNEAINPNPGFDIVIGNPPYVRHERLAPEFKEELKGRFPIIANGTADLYVYFYGIGLELLKGKGVLNYITLNKYLKTRYGLELRKLLANNYDVDIIIDFFELPVFEASTDTSITKIIASFNNIETKYYPVKTLENLNLFDLTSGSYQKTIKDETEWKFIDAIQESVLSKIYEETISLKEFSNNRIYNGIKTGANQTFVLEDEIAQKLINSADKDLVKKYAQSTDIKQWHLNDENRYFLATGYDLQIDKDYPVVYNYLLRFEERLKTRYDKGVNWWNLRACSYYDEFDKPKIIYMHTAKKHEFYYDIEGRYINNSCYMIISDSQFLFSFLNSKLFEWFKKIKFVAYGDAEGAGRAKLDYNKMITVPMKKVTDKVENIFTGLTNSIRLKKKNNENTNHLEQKIELMIYQLYNLTFEEIKIIDPEFELTKEEYKAIKIE